ncbi:SGNH/GDSL hydrolase family protein [archaeon]|nr:SGNH/GDSL hydrolase family protein [Candidatus Woesearchaeota archaeon]MBT3464949.1 SGNH/GDSL hydrolase family protein [archaeon]MBT4352795.1 SGNH/GDSL hydrolase family protein [archaeon]MBT4647566.1 SGNH/GDSL hydrolase family protein [archaeon]MBT6821938.1 SGNH/GDSL hydrolase family protein [archaeon]
MKGKLIFFVYILLLIIALEVNVKKFEKLPYYEPNVIFAVDFNEDNPHIHKESKIPGLIFELDSNVESTWQGVKIRTNSMGVRDREYDKKKPENTYRIIGLGDSVTFGANIDENETFLNILEEKLNYQSDKNFEVINAGVSAYNIIQYYISLKNKLMVYDPDLVILNFYQNDYIPINFLKKYKNFNQTYNAGGNYKREEILAQNLAGFFPFPFKWNYFLLKNFAFYRFLNIKSYNIASKINSDYYIPDAYTYLNGIEPVKENKQALLDIIELSKKEKFDLIIVVHPNLEKEDNNDKWIRTVPVQKYDVPTLDLYDHYISKNVSPVELKRVPQDFIHPNVRGNKIIGEAIYDFLIYEDLINIK